MRRTPGEHAPNAKNRSSKQLVGLTKVKPFYKSLSNDALAEYKTKGAQQERERRAKKRAKKNPEQTV